jgi:DNA processing protein
MHWDEEKKIPSIQTSLFTDVSDEEQLILSILKSEGELNVDVLSMKSKFPVSKTSVFLFNLEMIGAVKSLPGKKYRLI